MSKSKVLLPANKITDKWGKNMKASQSSILDAVEQVSENPMEGAAAAVESGKYLQKVTNAQGKMVGALRKVSLSDWKAAFKLKLPARLSSGVDAALPKRTQFDSWLVGRLNAILPEIKAMPSLTLQDSKDRVGKLMDHMAAQPYKTG